MERRRRDGGSGRMSRHALLVMLVLAGCAKGAEADLPYVAQARSLTAEWAMVNDQANRRQLTQTYAQTMRDQIRQQLQAIPASLSQSDAPYARAIAGVLQQPDEASPDRLRAYADALKQAEDELESA